MQEEIIELSRDIDTKIDKLISLANKSEDSKPIVKCRTILNEVMDVLPRERMGVNMNMPEIFYSLPLINLKGKTGIRVPLYANNAVDRSDKSHLLSNLFITAEEKIIGNDTVVDANTMFSLVTGTEYDLTRNPIAWHKAEDYRIYQHNDLTISQQIREYYNTYFAGEKNAFVLVNPKQFSKKICEYVDSSAVRVIWSNLIGDMMFYMGVFDDGSKKTGLYLDAEFVDLDKNVYLMQEGIHKINLEMQLVCGKENALIKGKFNLGVL